MKRRKTAKLRSSKRLKKKSCNKIARQRKNVGKGKRDYRKDGRMSTYFFRT